MSGNPFIEEEEQNPFLQEEEEDENPFDEKVEGVIEDLKEEGGLSEGVADAIENEREGKTENNLAEQREPTGLSSGSPFSEQENIFLSPDEESEGTGVDYQPQIYFQSSEEMKQLSSESVHLAVTSPPYNTGWDYGSADDDKDYKMEYLPMMAKVIHETYRVLVPGGRFCINVPSLLRSGAEGGYPIAADITKIALRNSRFNWYMNIYGDEMPDPPDFKMREQIAWVKTFNHDGLAPNGSFPRPWGVLLNNLHEAIIVLQKPGKRTYDDMEEDTIENSKINKKQDDLCDDVWYISPESWDFRYAGEENVPVFPEELPRRCIRLWTYEGDTVLDPFAGRFTTGKVAKELNRESVGYEIREDLKKDIESYTNMNNTGVDRFMGGE